MNSDKSLGQVGQGVNVVEDFIVYWCQQVASLVVLVHDGLELVLASEHSQDGCQSFAIGA
jgi:hypothetical protein